MAWICLKCGSLRWIENCQVAETYELGIEEAEENIDTEHYGDVEIVCFECNDDFLVQYDAYELTKNQRLKLRNQKDWKKRLKLLLEFALKNKKIMNKYNLKKLFEWCKTLKLIDERLEKLLIIYNL